MHNMEPVFWFPACSEINPPQNNMVMIQGSACGKWMRTKVFFMSAQKQPLTERALSKFMQNLTENFTMQLIVMHLFRSQRDILLL